MDEKVTMGSRIGQKQRDIVDELRNVLNVPKYRIYEASVYLFNVLPRLLQLALASDDVELRTQVFESVKKLTLLPKQEKDDKKK